MRAKTYTFGYLQCSLSRHDYGTGICHYAFTVAFKTLAGGGGGGGGGFCKFVRSLQPGID